MGECRRRMARLHASTAGRMFDHGGHNSDGTHHGVAGVHAGAPAGAVLAAVAVVGRVNSACVFRGVQQVHRAGIAMIAVRRIVGMPGCGCRFVP